MTGAGVAFEVQPADIPEDIRPGESPHGFARRIAGERALVVASRLGPAPSRVVLGADTVVVVEDRVLGKPRDAEHAVELLLDLTGRAHCVVTGIAVANSRTLEVASRSVETCVWMRSAAEGEIRSYVASGEPLDKAGAYALQGEGRRFVSRIEGSESNVIGLPVEETLALLAGSSPDAERR